MAAPRGSCGGGSVGTGDAVTVGGTVSVGVSSPSAPYAARHRSPSNIQTTIADGSRRATRHHRAAVSKHRTTMPPSMLRERDPCKTKDEASLRRRHQHVKTTAACLRFHENPY